MSAKNLKAIERECIANQVRFLNRVVTGAYDEALRPLGLTVGQLNVLVTAENRGPVPAAELCRSLQMGASTLSRNVERMRARGWLEELPGDDARSRPLRLTAKGRRMLREALPAWEAAQAGMRARLGREGTTALRRIARNVRGGTLSR